MFDQIIIFVLYFFPPKGGLKTNISSASTVTNCTLCLVRTKDSFWMDIQRPWNKPRNCLLVGLIFKNSNWIQTGSLKLMSRHGVKISRCQAIFIYHSLPIPDRDQLSWLHVARSVEQRYVVKNTNPFAVLLINGLLCYI